MGDCRSHDFNACDTAGYINLNAQPFFFFGLIGSIK